MNSSRPDGDDEYLALGYVSGVHGIKGWLKIHSYTDPREAILDYQPWLMGPERQAVKIVRGQASGKSVLVQLPEVNDRDAAQKLVRQQIAVRRAQLPDLPGQAYYWADLKGLEVVTSEGASLGTVTDFMETGAHDVMIVAGERERLIPFVIGHYVIRVDLAGGRIEVDWDPEY